MAFQKVAYGFPDEETADSEIEVENSSAVEIDISGSAKKDKAEAVDEETTDDSEYEVEVVDDTPKADRGRKASEPPVDVTEEELEEYSGKVRNRIKHLSKGYHDERRSKEQALRERQELETFAQRLVDENKELKGTVGKNQTAMLDQAKRSVINELETAKTAYKEAYEAGDSDAVVTAQESLTSAKIKADRLNNFKLPALQEDDTPVTVPESAPAVDPRAEDWAQANSWFGPDDEMTSFALGLHNKLVKSGVDPQSDDYYESLDSRMREVFPENFEGAEKPVNNKPKRRTTVVAPATRSTSPKTIRLTQTQVTIAKKLGVPLELYAKKVAEEMRKSDG
tara:strand:+ start:1114 stop:2127 length:1014 start_codon:yes stop_codon:yes gene_type:complete